MVPNPLIRLTYLDHVLRIIMSPRSSPQYYMLYNFVLNQTGLELMILASIMHLGKVKIGKPNHYASTPVYIEKFL